MVAICCVKGCKNSSRKLKRDDPNAVTFHVFPSNPESKLKWLQAIGRPNWDPPIHAKVCSAHFHMDHIDFDKSRKRMKLNACPILALPPNSNFDASAIEVCRFCLATDIKMYSLREGRLKTCLETIVGFNESHIAGLPQFACYECAAGLYKCYRLIGKSMVAQATLLDIHAKHGQITKSLINKENRTSLRLNSSLSNHRLTNYLEIKHNDSNFTPINLYDVPIENADNLQSNDALKIEIDETDNDVDEIDNDTSKIDNDSSKIDNDSSKIDNDTPKIDSDILEIDNDKLKIDISVDVKVEHLETFVTPMDITEDNPIELEEVQNKNDKIEDESEVIDDDDDDDDDEEDDDYKTSSPDNAEDDENSEDSDEPVEKNSEKALKDEYKIQKHFDVIKLSLAQQIEDWQKIHQSNGQHKYKCDVCGRTFAQENSYQNHVASHDPSNGTAECRVCHQRYRTANRLKHHAARTHDIKYQCKACPKSFSNAYLAKRHYRWHLGFRYQCAHCPFSTINASSLATHSRKHAIHGDACAYCGRTFQTKSGLNMHMSTVHKDLPKVDPGSKFRCDKCELTFSSEGARKVHYLTSAEHKNDTDLRDSKDSLAKTCRKCEVEFPTSRELRAHIKTEHPTSRRKRTWQMPDDHYPTQCEQCGAAVGNRREHWLHWRRAHPAAAYRAVVTAVCHACGKGFQNISKLRTHMARHSGGVVKCAECGRVCVDSDALRRHSQAHATTKPYACARCGRTFAYQSNLYRHARVHTSATPYDCSICHKKFKHSTSVKLHINTVHYKLPQPPRKKHSSKKSKNVTDQQ